MSLASYIGCNLELPLKDEEYSNDNLYIGDCFAGEDERLKVKRHQFSTSNVYEVSSHWGIEITEHVDQNTLTESKMKLLELCKRMDGYLKTGDYFELYSCWIGEEDEIRHGELHLKLSNFDIDHVEIPEKTLVRFTI